MSGTPSGTAAYSFVASGNPNDGGGRIFTINPGKIGRFLFFCNLALALLHVAVYFFKLQHSPEHRPSLLLNRLFRMEIEANIPTVYSTLLLATAAFLLFVVYRVEQAGKPRRRQWLLLSAVFLFLAFDEGAALHDELVGFFRGRISNDLGGLLYEAWVIPYAILVAALGMYMLPFVLRLPARTRKLFIFAALLFVGGALGLELLEGVQEKNVGVKNNVFRILNGVEEFCEINGVSLFIYALLDYLSPLRLRVHTGQEAAVVS